MIQRDRIPATLHVDGFKQPLHCGLGAFSNEGVTIKVYPAVTLEPGYLPSKCRLRAPAIHLDNPCRVVWRTEDCIGIAFTT